MTVADTPFGWVKQRGVGWVKFDISDVNAPVRFEFAIPTAGGLVRGHTDAGTTADEIANNIGQFTFGGTSDVDSLFIINLNINNDAVSYRFPVRGAKYDQSR